MAWSVGPQNRGGSLRSARKMARLIRGFKLRSDGIGRLQKSEMRHPRTALGSLAAPGSLRSCIRKPYRDWRPPNSVLKNMITPHDCNKTHEGSKLEPKVCSDSLGSLICRRHSLQYVCTRDRERARSLQGRALQRDAPAADWQARIRVRIKDEVADIECQTTQHLDRGCGCATAPPIAKRLHALQLPTEKTRGHPSARCLLCSSFPVLP